MIALENILEDLVKDLPDTTVGKAVFYWGTSEDLPQFLAVYKEDSIPLIWLVSGYDKPTEDGYYRDAEIAFCTREDRKDLLNLTRVKDNYSYKTVLIPLLEAFLEAVSISGNVWTEEDKPEYLKSPNHEINGEKEAADIWDVLKIKQRIYFNEDYDC